MDPNVLRVLRVLPALLLLAHVAAAGIDGFAGSARCGSCHRIQHEKWTGDWHRRALAPPDVAPKDAALMSAATVVGTFDPPAPFTSSGTRAEARKDGDRYVMKAEDREGVQRVFGIDFVIGGRRMQDYLTRFPDGRLQVLPIYFHVTGTPGAKPAWVDYTTQKQGALSRDHPFYWTNYARSFNKECIGCHVTGPSIGWNEAAGRFDTVWSEPGVSCESCHGAGARHAGNGERASIVRPSALSEERAGAVCAACHAGRAPWRSAFSQAALFRPGQLFEDVFEPLTPVLGKDDLSGDFWLDGRPSAGSLESTALEQSACARRGPLTCLTCHTAPHGNGGLSEMKPAARTGEVCLGCHGAYREAAARARHTFHAAGTPGSSCIDCHMPKTVTGVLDAQADHAIDVPNPWNRRDFGIPDACTSCHSGKDASWSIAQISMRFPLSTRSRRRQRLALAQSLWVKEDPRAEEAFTGILRDVRESPFLRANAATALASVARSRSASAAAIALIRSLDDPSVVIAARAARALGTRREKSAAAALVRAASSSRDFVALSAALALLDLADPRAPELTAALLERPALRGDYRLETALGLVAGRGGQLDAALAHLLRAIEDRPDFVKARELAAPLLTALGRPEEAARQLERARYFRHTSHRGKRAAG